MHTTYISIMHYMYSIMYNWYTHTHTHTSVVAWDADSDHFPLCVSVWIIQRGPPPSVQAPALPWVGQDGVLPLTGWPWVSTTLNCAHCGQCHEQRARHTGQWTCDTHALYMYIHITLRSVLCALFWTRHTVLYTVNTVWLHQCGTQCGTLCGSALGGQVVHRCTQNVFIPPTNV